MITYCICLQVNKCYLTSLLQKKKGRQGGSWSGYCFAQLLHIKMVSYIIGRFGTFSLLQAYLFIGDALPNKLLTKYLFIVDVLICQY